MKLFIPINNNDDYHATFNRKGKKKEESTGIVRIEKAFIDAQERGECALITFICGGYETRELSIEILLKMEDAGADVIEVGVPCENPFADGPTIRSTHRLSRENGTRGVRDVLKIVRAARTKGLLKPVILMGYFESFLKEYGFELDQMHQDAAESGVDGFLVVGFQDRKTELQFNNSCHKFGLSYIPLILPNSSDESIKNVVEMASTWIYIVSSTGKTGARDSLPEELSKRVEAVRALSDLPLAVGFGISNPDMIREVANLCDGVVVGSYLTDCMNKKELKEDKVEEVQNQVKRLKTGVRRESVKYSAKRYSQVPLNIFNEDDEQPLCADY